MYQPATEVAGYVLSSLRDDFHRRLKALIDKGSLLRQKPAPKGAKLFLEIRPEYLGNPEWLGL